MRKLIGSALLALACLNGSTALAVIDPLVCLQNLETNFFQPALVQQGLSLYEIPQGVWSPIIQDLQGGSIGIPNRMKRKTAMMVHNPLAYPLQRGEAAKILKATLYEVFMETMARYAVNEQPTADLVFDYIFSKQMDNLVQCLGDEVRELAPRFE